jgi:hypothetical protein
MHEVIQESQNQKIILKRITISWVLFLLILVAIQYHTIVTAANEEVFTSDFTYNALDRVKVSAPFKLEHGTKNAIVSCASLLGNNWLQLDISLIHSDTGEEIPFKLGLEYYSGKNSIDRWKNYNPPGRKRHHGVHGVGKEGYWNEGNHRAHKVLSSISEGNYYLKIEAFGGAGLTGKEYTVWVNRDEPMWRNFLLVAAFATVFPIASWVRYRLVMEYGWKASRSFRLVPGMNIVKVYLILGITMCLVLFITNGRGFILWPGKDTGGRTSYHAFGIF